MPRCLPYAHEHSVPGVGHQPVRGPLIGGGRSRAYAGVMAKADNDALFGRWGGAALAIGSALLFGASTPAAKVLLGATDPWLLAAILYLGSGVGLLVIRLLGRAVAPQAARQTALHG